MTQRACLHSMPVWELSQVFSGLAYSGAPALLGPADDLSAARQVLRGADRSELNYRARPT